MKMLKIISLSIIICLFYLTSFAQNTWQWAVRAGGFASGNTSPDATIKGIVTDAAGNIYACGTILGPGATAGNVALTTYGSYDIFIAKYDCAGNLIWTKTAGSNGVDEANDIAIDDFANIYVTGKVFGNQFSPLTFIDTVITESTIDMFIVKLDSSGNRLWHKIASPGANNMNSIGFKLSIDDNSNLNVIAGVGGSTVGDLFPGYPLVRGNYFIKLDNDGNILQVSTISDVNFVGGINDYKISNAGDNYITGHFSSDSIVFGINDTVLYKISSAGSDLYLAKFDGLGSFEWARQIGAPVANFSDGYGITIYNNTVYICGNTVDSVMIGATILIDSLNANGNSDFPFIAAFTQQGQPLWAINSHHQYVSRAIAGLTIVQDKIYYGGFHGGQANFGTISFPNSTGIKDFFIAEVDLNNMNFDNAEKIYGSGSKEQVQSITSDIFGNIYIGGAFDGTMTVGNSTITYAGGNTDAFIAKWGTGNCLTSIEDNGTIKESNIFLFPNPAEDFVNIVTNLNGKLTLTIYNSVGKTELNKIFYSTDNYKFYVDNFMPGIYIAEIKNESGGRILKKLVVLK